MLADARLALQPTSSARRLRSRLVLVLAAAAFVVALIPLVAVGSYIVSQGIGVIRPEFFLEDPPGDLSQVGGGIRNAITGTLEMTGLATLIALPIGLLIAIFNAEIGGRPATAVRFVIDVLAGLPSIVVGIFVYELVVVAQGHFSGLAGAAALALIMLPIIVVSTEEMLRLTPRPDRRGRPRPRPEPLAVLHRGLPADGPVRASSPAYCSRSRGPSARRRRSSSPRSATTSSPPTSGSRCRGCRS